MRFLFPVLFLLSTFAQAAAPAADSLERFRAFIKQTQSLRAAFDQKVYGREGKVTQQSAGSFVFLRPGRFRWTYEKPIDQLIVGDGERVWIYDRDLNQVTVRRLSRALGSTPAALLAGSSEVEKAFALRDAGEREGLQWVEALPKEAEAGFERILIGFGPDHIRAMQLVDHFGNTTVLTFRNVQRNPKVDLADFRFEPPKGADVLGEK